MKDIRSQLPESGPDSLQIAKWIDRYGEEELVTRMEEGHFTAAGFIFNPQRTKVLMSHHNIFKTWAWTGGHADGETDLLNVALKEAEEETGAKCRPIDGLACSAAIIPVIQHEKRGKTVKAHVHLNLAYALECEEDAVLRVKPDENSGVGWIDLSDLESRVSQDDVHIMPIYRRIIAKYASV